MKPQIKKINSNLIKSDMDYQRPVDMKRVNKIVKDFDERLLNRVKVSKRGEYYYIVDGQHTFEALKIMHEGEDFLVDCLVFEGLTKEEEAVLFARQNGYSKPVSKRDQLKALYTANDKTIMEIMRLVEQAGLEISFMSRSNGPNKIVAVVKLEKIYQNMENEDFVNMLTAIRKAWHGDKDSLAAEILGGMYLFYKIYKGQFNEKKLIERLSKVKPMIIIRDGKALLWKGDIRFAREIVKIYNYKNRFKVDEILLELWRSKNS